MALTSDQKRNIIEQRLQQFEAELFQHELNRDVAQVINSNEVTQQCEAAIAQLNVAINLYQQQLDNINGDA